MIHDIDAALQRLLRDSIGDDEVDFALEAPTREWAAKRSRPTVALYLYDIREDLQRRTNGAFDETGPDGHVRARRPALRYVRLAYLVTAWAGRPDDEHRLLARVLDHFLGRATVPVDGLPPDRPPVLASVALPPADERRSLADLWSAMGAELKPSLDLVVTAPWPAQGGRPAAELVRERPVVDLHEVDR